MNAVTVTLNGKNRQFCTECGVETTEGSFEAFNHRGQHCPYLASGRYFIPDDVRVRDAIRYATFVPCAEVF